jgi:LuxR family maltose regulon positive regulatory protein
MSGRVDRESACARVERHGGNRAKVLQEDAGDNNSTGIEDSNIHGEAGRHVGTAGRLVEELTVPAYREGRVTTLQRWFRWLEDQDGITGHPLAAVWAAILAARTGRPVEADRWADAVDRWQHQTEAQPDSPVVAAWAAVLRALLCRHGVEQMSADADEAARKLTAAAVVAPVAPLVKGIAGP